jgi:hypothetical protein
MRAERVPNDENTSQRGEKVGEGMELLVALLLFVGVFFRVLANVFMEERADRRTAHHLPVESRWDVTIVVGVALMELDGKSVGQGVVTCGLDSRRVDWSHLN